MLSTAMDNSVLWKVLGDDMMALRIYVCDGKFLTQYDTTCIKASVISLLFHYFYYGVNRGVVGGDF